jgi:hypothetical protein
MGIAVTLGVALSSAASLLETLFDFFEFDLCQCRTGKSGLQFLDLGSTAHTDQNRGLKVEPAPLPSRDSLSHRQSTQADCLLWLGTPVVANRFSQEKDGKYPKALQQSNVPVFCDIVPNTITAAPDAVLLVATNHFDVMTELSRRLAAGKAVLGNGHLS